ncbi:MAG: hypothetical protein U0N62_05415, partial [Hydrogeniiclostridium sp.]
RFPQALSRGESLSFPDTCGRDSVPPHCKTAGIREKRANSGIALLPAVLYNILKSYAERRAGDSTGTAAQTPPQWF